jgi:uncharacterized membrane protein YdjX (TVP38/TMEM64 family)
MTLNLRRWAAPLMIAALMLVVFATGLHEYLSLQNLAENRQQLRSVTAANLTLAIAVYMLVYAACVTLSIPGSAILTIMGGFLFGWVVGGVATVFAATLGASAVFQIAKSSFGDALTKRAGPFLTRFKDGFAADAFNYLLFLRLVPAFPFWLVNIAPALANVKLRTFAAATFLGIIPGTFAFAFVGEGLDSVIAAQTRANAACLAEKGPASCPFDLSLSGLITTQLLIAFAALGVVALIPVVLKKWKS